MKTHDGLYPKICSFENLWRAARKAQRGKRFKDNVAYFNFHLEHELFRLQEELLSQTYQPGEYHEFAIYEPKKRMISAAPYRDRVVHHVLCNVIEPIFERTFIFDSYACRVGKKNNYTVNIISVTAMILSCLPKAKRDCMKSKNRWRNIWFRCG